MSIKLYFNNILDYMHWIQPRMQLRKH